jgi:tRNA threonylcarbamoyladenosine biosynthesis protein TsaE
MRKANLQEAEEEFFTDSEEETILVARDLAKFFKGKEVVLIVGELGAGKTVFVKGIAAGLELRSVHQVCSPSFTLVNIYHAKYPIFHIDLYRLEKKSEIMDLGWEDYLEQGVVVVEWAEKIPFSLEGISVHIEIGKDDQRKIRICRKSS